MSSVGNTRKDDKTQECAAGGEATCVGELRRSVAGIRDWEKPVWADVLSDGMVEA